MRHLYALGATLVVLGLVGLGLGTTAVGIMAINATTVLLQGQRRGGPAPRLAHWPDDLDIPIPDLARPPLSSGRG